ncbi:MAG: site-specific integrase [Candidatus Thermoplasmatota archaeon]|nr:site-specific integrase [Candidatus Thermoplasmatota archaeon]
MTFQPKHRKMLENDEIRRWWENNRARSPLSADVLLRNIGLYCEINSTSPERILKDAESGELKRQFSDFVRKMETEGKAGSYIVKFKHAIRNWLNFNDITASFNGIYISGEYENPTLRDERVPSKDELSRIIRKATSRGRVAIAIMAYSGLRPESLGNYEGTDGLRLGDVSELAISNGIEIKNVPAQITVRSRLSKARNQYFSFIGEEGITYIRDYLEERMKTGEKLTPESPLLQFDVRGTRKNDFMRTLLVTRDIRDAIQGAGLKMRPYVLRAYFSTALDIAESKGLISHPWRQFIMGHKGDIEARYSTNKRLPPDMIEEMRESYKKCLKFLETRISDVSEDNAKLFLQQQLLSAVGYKQEEIDKIDLINISNEEFQQLLRDKVAGAMTENGAKQKVIPVSDVEKYIQEGYDFEAVLPNGKAVMRLRF